MKKDRKIQTVRKRGAMMNNTYKSAGVDVEEGQKAVELMKNAVKETFTNNVLTGLGGFGGLFELDMEGINKPVLVSGTDGVGTKLKLAFMMDQHDTIGQDCVAMCVNDILCQGAKPLFFLDYLATGKLKAERAETIVTGIAKACKESGAALIGGETAEMPGFYDEGEYDLAGFVVGIVDKERIITGENIRPGDALVGIASSGVHSNGFSLARKIFFEQKNMKPTEHSLRLGKTIGEALLTPTKLYVKPILTLLDTVKVKGMSHITGGGFYENIPRMLPEGTGVKIKENSFPVPEIFKMIQDMGKIDEREMYKTFNMGIGMVLAVSPEDLEKTLTTLKASGEEAYPIGEIIKETKESRESVIVWKE